MLRADSPLMLTVERNSAGGNAKRLLVDFLIGAHARLKADRRLTLDASRYRTDFRDLTLL